MDSPFEGNTIDFMDPKKRRIFSRFSPEAPFIRGVDIANDLIGTKDDQLSKLTRFQLVRLKRTGIIF